jgi:GAF domain-containing protein
VSDVEGLGLAYKIATFVHDDVSMELALERLLAVAQEAVPAADGSGLSACAPTGRPIASVHSDERTGRVGAVQHEAGRGPIIDAWRQQRIVLIDEIDEMGDQYPEVARAAWGAGVRSLLIVPVRAGQQPVGVLEFHASDPRAFGCRDEHEAQVLSLPLGAAISNVSSYLRAQDLAGNLTAAMASRATIEQAKGIVMAAMRCDSAEAFDVLRSQSQAENRKLREIAAEIVAAQAR